jgi:predicted TIM-barrel fold metal-dependent hydrolase
VVRPQLSADGLAAELGKPGVLGVKPYYSLIGEDRTTRDAHLEADIFDFLPHHMLEILNDWGAWVTLHVPKRDRLGHPANIAQIKEIRKRYPDVVLVIAHLGRCYTEPHAAEAIPQLAEDTGLYFDVSAVLNPAALRIALTQIGPDRLLYGTDNPVFYMRGRRQWSGREYVNRTDHDFHFNKEREAPEVEAQYTLYMYEAIKAIREVCEELHITRAEVEKIFHSNAEQLVQRVIDDKPRQEQYNDGPARE